MYLFIATHLGSGASMLCDSLAMHPHIARSYRNTYSHPSDLIKMKEFKPAKVFFDKLCFNTQLRSNSLYKSANFIYVVREPSPSLHHIVEYKGYSPEAALNYYCFRLRRLCEMAKHTPESLLVTWDDLLSKRAFSMIQEYIGLKQPLQITYDPEEIEITYPYDLICKAQNSYEKYLLYLRRTLIHQT